RTNRFRGDQVLSLMNQNGIRAQATRTRASDRLNLQHDEWTVIGLAAAVAMPTATVYTWIYRGWLTARRDPGSGCWVVTGAAAEIQRLPQLHARPRGYHPRQRWTAAQADQHTPDPGGET